MHPYNANQLYFLKRALKTIVFVAAFCYIHTVYGKANSIRTGVTFNWADNQGALSDPATLQSIAINGVDYNTFVVPSTYEMTRLGPGGHVENNIWSNGSRIIAGSDHPTWTASALQHETFYDPVVY